MRFAVIADIHGNRLALDAVLADIAALGVTEIVNLGDCLSGPLEAGRTADRLMELDLPTVRGNHDRWLVENDPATMGPSDVVAFRELDARHLDWLAGLPPTLTLWDDVFLCHATPESDTTYWLDRLGADAAMRLRPLAEIEAAAEGIDASLILCGHTHIPRAVRLRDGRLVVNPGSVGCPGYTDEAPVPHIVQAGAPDASYAILEQTAGGWSVTFRLVPYDSEAAAAQARRHGRDDWADALSTGWIEA